MLLKNLSTGKKKKKPSGPESINDMFQQTQEEKKYYISCTQILPEIWRGLILWRSYAESEMRQR